jgi:hypothetical protein
MPKTLFSKTVGESFAFDLQKLRADEIANGSAPATTVSVTIE